MSHIHLFYFFSDGSGDLYSKVEGMPLVHYLCVLRSTININNPGAYIYGLTIYIAIDSN